MASASRRQDAAPPDCNSRSPEKFLGMTEQADIVISVRELMRSSRRRVSGKGLGSQIEFLKFGIEKYVLAG